MEEVGDSLVSSRDTDVVGGESLNFAASCAHEEYSSSFVTGDDHASFILATTLSRNGITFLREGCKKTGIQDISRESTTRDTMQSERQKIS